MMPTVLMTTPILLSSPMLSAAGGSIGDQGVEAAQQASLIKPHLTCELTHEEDWERAPDGTIRISNLTPIQLLVELTTGGVEVEPLKVADKWRPEATAEVKVYELDGEEREAVPIKLSRTGRVGRGVVQQLDLWLDIPVSEETFNAGVEEWLTWLEEASRKEGRYEEFKHLTANREEMLKEGLRDYGTWNRSGRLEIRCSYESDAEGVWNGVLQAEPLILEVVDDGTVFDKMMPPDGEEP